MIHRIQRALDASPCVAAHGVRVVTCGDDVLSFVADSPPNSRDASGYVATSTLFALAEAGAQVAAQLEAGRRGVPLRQKSARIKYYGATREAVCAVVRLQGTSPDLRVDVSLATAEGSKLAQYDAHFTA